MAEMMAEFSAQMNALPQAVQYWMQWMMLVFALSIVFAWWYVPARWVFVTFFVLTIAGAYGQFYFTQSVHWIAAVHLVLWIPLLVYLVGTVMRRPDFRAASPFGIWLILVVLTMLVSLAFDARDVFLLLNGQK